MSKRQKSKEQEHYDPFKNDDNQEEVEQRWGITEAYRQSMKRVQRMTKEEMEKFKEGAELLAKNDRHRSGLAVFVRNAIVYFCDIRESQE